LGQTSDPDGIRPTSNGGGGAGSNGARPTSRRVRSRPIVRHAAGLRAYGRVVVCLAAGGVAILLAYELVGPWAAVAAGSLAGASTGVQWRRLRLAREPVRTLLVGPPASLLTLREELGFYGIGRYVLVGSLTPVGRGTGHELELGTVPDLRSVIEEHDVKLVLMSSQASRMAVFDAIARDCADLDVHVCDLCEFYEDVFGYTPIAEINSAWLSSILHPGFRAPSFVLKRLSDIAFAVIVGVVCLPLLAVLAYVVRRDGGRALFSQLRVGERGRPFKMHKLRTMGVGWTEDTSWATAGDPRVTAVGRALRRLHLDELPQLWNILRGDMTVVGPRPEQPVIASRLEEELPFFHLRHMVRPGLAGWAQARCGYAGSDSGVAWKLSHDLYYVKRRSLRFDLRVLLESIWHALAGNQFQELRRTEVVVRPANTPGPETVATEERTALELELREHS
jgi:lipopolysaccharide/colanic/teichoic acid biosynthesis glycosyltransferase